MQLPNEKCVCLLENGTVINVIPVNIIPREFPCFQGSNGVLYHENGKSFIGKSRDPERVTYDIVKPLTEDEFYDYQLKTLDNPPQP